MSKFYATIQGQAGEATRRGSVNSGIRASVQSWNGSVITDLSEDKDGKTIVSVSFSNDSSSYGREVFKGTISELVAKLTA